MKQLHTITQVYRYLEITKKYKMFFEIVIYCLIQCLKQWLMNSQIFIEWTEKKLILSTFSLFYALYYI